MVTVRTGLDTTITIEQTNVTRYTALGETAAGFTITPNDGDRHFQSIEFPGVVQIPSVIFYRTRHIGLPRFSVRINSASLTEYIFAENDPPERCWHEIIPGSVAGQPTLMAQNNELVFAVSNGTVTFGDVVTFYTSNETTIKIPLTLHP
jgi:hypothetical protein